MAASHLLCFLLPLFAAMLGFMSILKKTVRKIIYETIINNGHGALNVLSDSTFSSQVESKRCLDF